MSIVERLRRPTPPNPATMTAAAFSLLAGSGLLLWMHAASVREMREVGLPAALALPRIERRMDILTQQNEIAELQAALRGGSEEERLRVYVLPAEEHLDRLLATFDVLFSYLEQKRRLMSVSGVEVGQSEEWGKGSLSALPVTFEAVVTQQGLADILLFSELSGLLTVSDVLTSADIDAFLALTEEENPASVAALENFLVTDLLRYSEEPTSFEEQLRKSFSPVAEESLHALLEGSHLRRARTFFGEIAPVLRQQNLWPLRLLTIENAAFRQENNGLFRLTLTLQAYVRQD